LRIILNKLQLYRRRAPCATAFAARTPNIW
jgi:hypothetical protein